MLEKNQNKALIISETVTQSCSMKRIFRNELQNSQGKKYSYGPLLLQFVNFHQENNHSIKNSQFPSDLKLVDVIFCYKKKQKPRETNKGKKLITIGTVF